MATASASATPSPPQYQQPRPEPCALVAGIISKFSTSASIFAAWRAKRRAKNPLENPEAAADCQRLAACLNNSGPVVQAEYDRDFRYFGSRFSVGDVPTRHTLIHCLNNLQTRITLVIQTALVRNIIDLPTSTLLSHATSARHVAIEALAAQYNRLATTQPLRPVSSLSPLSSEGNPVDRTKADFNISHLYCGIALLLQQTSGPMPLRFLIGLPCAICGTILPSAAVDIRKTTSGGNSTALRVTTRFLAKCHLAAKDAGYGCVICEKSGREIPLFGDVASFLEHIKQHGFGELVDEGTLNDIRKR